MLAGDGAGHNCGLRHCGCLGFILPFTPACAPVGRYWVILSFSVLYMGGLAGLTASAGDSSLHPAPGEQATSSQLALFWAMMYLIAVGTGGIKPCVSTFGADQFDESKPSEARLIPRFFNWCACGASGRMPLPAERRFEPHPSSILFTPPRLFYWGRAGFTGR